ncbi:MAG: zinc-ribbon domain-containing protein [Deltaproteobacteria bacterium]|nr:zinc-ribbon domain-containing protein [Deltaproteobacteria bacterium]
MNVVCEKCQSKFQIPSQKVPKGQAFSVICPKCSNKVTVDPRADISLSAKEKAAPSAKPKPVRNKTIIEEVDSSAYDASEKPFDFVEQGVETALLCEPDPALKQMRFHVFDMVVLNESFGTRDPDMNSVLKYLDRLNMSIRRNIFLALITTRFRTMDNMTAFNKSVNLIINLKNINEIEKILRRGLADNKAFYRVFKESLIKTGRI